MTRIVETDRFLVKTDIGKEYTIIQSQEYISVESLNNPPGEIAGMKRLSTSTGLTVSPIDSKTFKIIETNEIVRKV